MNDVIDRQAAIDAINARRSVYSGMWGKGLSMAVDTLRDLPSAQSTISKMEQVEDCISRQAAIAHAVPLNLFGREVMMVSVSELENLPSAQPERNKGRYIRNDNGTYSCSVCQSWIPEQQHCYARYCLYCGADMRGGQDG